MPPVTRFQLEVETGETGLRLDQFLAARIPELSRRQARVLIDLGGVFVDRRRVKVAGRKLGHGQVVTAHLGGAFLRSTKKVGREAREADESPLQPFEVLHQDADIVVAVKPAGLLTAPTPESDRNNLATLLESRCGGRIFVVHRLDLETSGVLVFARTEHANRTLSDAFRDRRCEREYRLALRGPLPHDAWTIREPIAGRAAATRFVVESRRAAGEIVIARATLESGRTHQIRLHALASGSHVLGDRRYGSHTPADPPRMALHAHRLGFLHPVSGESLSFSAPWPAELAAWERELPG